MSILINQNGKVLAKTTVINKLLSPVNTGRFNISTQANKFVSENLTEENSQQLFEFIPREMQQYCHELKLIQTRASIFDKTTEHSPTARSDTSETPHINSGDEIHFFFGGSYILYFNINHHHYALIIEAGDWVFIPADIEHWIKATDDQYLIIVSYHCEPFDIFHSKVKYTDTKSQAYI